VERAITVVHKATSACPHATPGKYYFEAVVTDDGLCRVGWASALGTRDIGTDRFTFGFGGTGKVGLVVFWCVCCAVWWCTYLYVYLYRERERYECLWSVISRPHTHSHHRLRTTANSTTMEGLLPRGMWVAIY